MHGCGFLQVCGNLRQNSFLCIGGFERQNAFQRFAHAWLANAKGNARMSLHFFPAQREAQLIKEKLLENQAAVCRRAKLVEKLQGHIGGRKMNEAKGVAAGRKIISCEQRGGQSVERRCGKILQGAVDNPPQYTRADLFNRFIDRHDPAHLGGIRSICAK